MLLPALGKTQQVAKGITCTGGLKQLGTAFQMFANDNNDVAVNCYTADKSAYNTAAKLWEERLLSYVGGPSQVPNDYKTSGFKMPKFFFCPVVTTWVYSMGELDFTNYSYAAQIGYKWGTMDNTRKVTQCQAPSRIFVLGDWKSGTDQLWASGTAPFRHVGWNQYVAVDGHTEKIKLDFNWNPKLSTQEYNDYWSPMNRWPK